MKNRIIRIMNNQPTKRTWLKGKARAIQEMPLDIKSVDGTTPNIILHHGRYRGFILGVPSGQYILDIPEEREESFEFYEPHIWTYRPDPTKKGQSSLYHCELVSDSIKSGHIIEITSDLP